MNDHFGYIFGEYAADKYPDVAVSIERITPSVAQSMLGANTHNRDTNRFETISKALKNGEWSLNGASIVFSDDGVLLDGQHRLIACVKTGIAFDTIVVRGIEKRQQMTMDVGTKRKVADFLKLDGYPDPSLVASIGNAIYRADYLGLSESFTRATAEKGTLLATVDFIEDNYETRIGPLKSLVRTVSRRYRGVYSATIGPLFDVFRRAGDEDFDAFIDQLLGKAEPCKTVELLISRLDENVRKTSGKLTQKVIAALFIKTWNAFMSGEQLGTLAYRQGGAHPEAFPEVYLG